MFTLLRNGKIFCELLLEMKGRGKRKRKKELLLQTQQSEMELGVGGEVGGYTIIWSIRGDAT